MFRDYSMLITSYKIGEVHFLLLGTNGFHVKAKNGRFTAPGSRCRQNLKYENFTSLFGRLRQKIAAKSVPHVQHDYFSLFNQSDHCFLASSVTGSLIAWIRWIRKNNRAARPARTLVQFFDVVCQMTISKFKVSTTTLTHNRKSFILYIYFNAFY